MPPSPLVSVLVTVYNREAYLRSTLESILKSGFDDFEVLVVDDRSSDRSLEIAEQVAKTDTRISVHANPENLGDYGNRMKAASLARGTYLKYVDSDDLIYDHSLRVMVDGMSTYPDAVLGLSHSLPEDSEPYPWKLDPEACYRKHFLDRGCLACGPSGAIIRRDAFEQIGGFRQRWGVLSDTDLWLRLAARWPIVLLPPALVWWRRHEDQEFTKDDAGDIYLQRGYELDMQALQPGCPLPEDLRLEATERKKQHHARRILSLSLRQRRLSDALSLYRQSDLSMLDLLRGLSTYR